MANITKKAGRLLSGLACTCPNSILFSSIERFGISKEVVDLLPHDGNFADLKKLITSKSEEDQIFCIISHFVGEKHFDYAKKPMPIVKEIPEKLRPALQQLLPLGRDDTYRNRGVNVKMENLIEIGHKSFGKGFWVAHLCGKVWISAKETSPGDIIARQADIPGFLESLKGVQMVDVKSYQSLYESTSESVKILSKYL